MSAKSAPPREGGGLAPCKRKLQKRSHDTRSMIVSAALEVFADLGFDGAGTRAIAERAGVTQALLTYHFGSKAELWRHVAASIFRDLTARYSAAPSDEHAPPLERVRAAFRHMFRSTLERPEVHQFMLRESRPGSARLTWLVEHHLRPYLERMLPEIASAQQCGELPGSDPVMLYYMILGMTTMPASLGPEMEAITGQSCRTSVNAERYWDLIDEVIFRPRTTPGMN